MKSGTPKPVVTRFAPSPTGYLHVGGARTALLSWLYARHNAGKFVLRIEDTDSERSTEESAQAILDAMTWLGLTWDEGPYYQSQRLEIYQKHLIQLKNAGFIYPAFETKEELERQRQQAKAENRNPIYDRSSLRLSSDEVNARMEAGDRFVWRFKVPDDEVVKVPEILMGSDDRLIHTSAIGDFVLTRPGTIDVPGMPLYNFVCTIDDALMGISHVIRGVEHLTNAVSQVLLYNALGYEVPEFVHLPLIMKNGRKMSKRDPEASGLYPISVTGRRDKGYLAEPTLNHLALLGWSPAHGRETMSLAEMVEAFDIGRLSRANANFDEAKYLVFNGRYLKSMSDSQLLEFVRPFLIEAGLPVCIYDDIDLQKMIALEKGGRCRLLADFPDALRFYFSAPDSYEKSSADKYLNRADIDVVDVLRKTAENVLSVENFNIDVLEVMLKKTVNETNTVFSIFGPIIRIALVGKNQSPNLADIMEILGADETAHRLRNTISYIEESNLSNA